MSNVVSIRTRQPVTLAPPPIIALEPMPAWVTSDPDKNRKVMHIQGKGWTVRTTPDRRIWCWNPRVVTKGNAPMSLEKALQTQAMFDAIEERIRKTPSSTGVKN